MSDELRELVGDDVPEPELERLRTADALLRITPAPPELPDTLTSAVLAIPGRTGGGSRRRMLAELGLAAALAAGTFGIGIWVGGDSDGPPVFEEITLDATAQAPREARMVIDVLPRDEAGNWAMAADASGLPPLPEGGYYEVWMTKSGELAESCGRFVVDELGTAENVWLNAPYAFSGFDRWVVVAMLPGQEPSEWLLDGPVLAPA
jgi:hypothetical protein